MQAVVNAIFYILCAGCAWRLLPHDFPAWQTVYYYFRRWREDGTWVKLNAKLQQWVRVSEDRNPLPSAAILDSQSVKHAAPHSNVVGYDGGKGVKGRKRFTLVDTIGLVIMVTVIAASCSEQHGARQLLSRLKQQRQDICTRLARIWVDAGYQGNKLMHWVLEKCQFVIEVVLRPSHSKGFTPVPKRWVVERTFGWFNHWRRLSKDYEILPETTEAFIYAGMVRLMLKPTFRGLLCESDNIFGRETIEPENVAQRG